MPETPQIEDGATGLERVRDASPGAGRGAGESVLNRLNAFTEIARDRVMAMPAGKRAWLGASALLLAAFVAGLSWYAQRPDWRVLFIGLDARDSQQITQELAAAGIPYEITPDGGGVKVSEEQIDKARMAVAAKGMPLSGRMGFELFDKPNWVGSEFDEKVNYQRALEGELEHTIGTLSAVQSARVHLVMPKDSMFASERKDAKASVVLKMRRTTLPPEQVDAIRNLIAGAVENLSPDEVALVDADGRQSFSKPGGAATQAEAEQALADKVVAMLEPLAGRDNVRATVTINYDESSQERTDEVYDPSQVAALTMQKSTQSSEPSSRPGGVPGTGSNTAGAATTAGTGTTGTAAAPPPPPGLSVYPRNGGSIQNLAEENGSYAVTKHLTHSEEGPGRVRRVTAAVVVNDRMTTQGSGRSSHAVWTPRNAEEMRSLEQLAQAAVGFDARRGDAVVLQNVSFLSNQAPAASSFQELLSQGGEILRNPAVLRSLAVVALGVLLVFAVLRPALKQAMQMELAAKTESAAASVEVVDAPQLTSGEEQALASRTLELPKFTIDPSLLEAQGVFEQVADYIRRDPAQSTRIVESWISSVPEERS